MSTNFTKIYGYTRISTNVTKQVFSLDDQKQKITHYANQLNIPCEIIQDEVSGGKNFDSRNGLNHILKIIKKDECIVITTLDRLSRNLKHLLEIIDLAKQKGFFIHCLSLNITVPKDLISNFIIQIIGQIAELEREMIASRVKASHLYRKQNNLYKKQIPWWETKSTSELENYKKQELIKHIKHLHQEGHTYHFIADWLNKMKYKSKHGGIFYPYQISKIVKYYIDKGELDQSKIHLLNAGILQK